MLEGAPFFGDQTGAIAVTLIVPVEASRTPVTFTVRLRKSWAFC